MHGFILVVYSCCTYVNLLTYVCTGQLLAA